MSKITDEANRIVKMTNDSEYMGYSFVSEAQRQAVNVLNYVTCVLACIFIRGFKPFL